jgi:hypothetical protein
MARRMEVLSMLTDGSLEVTSRRASLSQGN